MDTSVVQAIKLEALSTLGLSRDALHVYVGLGVYVAAAGLIRKSLRSSVPWVLVLVVAGLGEALDLWDDIANFGYWRWTLSLHDLANTLFWPSVIVLLVRFGIIRTEGS